MKPPTVQQLVDGQVSADPLTRAIVDATEAGTTRALRSHLPKLVLTRTEAAEMLGVSVSVVDRLAGEGRLEQFVTGRYTLASVLRVAGWPVVPAPVGAPLTVVPAVAS